MSDQILLDELVNSGLRSRSTVFAGMGVDTTRQCLDYKIFSQGLCQRGK